MPRTQSRSPWPVEGAEALKADWKQMPGLSKSLSHPGSPGYRDDASEGWDESRRGSLPPGLLKGHRSAQVSADSSLWTVVGAGAWTGKEASRGDRGC